MRLPHASTFWFLTLPLILLAAAAGAEEWTLVGWNNLGMHCMDPDYGVFALLPPYNTLEAQLVDDAGQLVTRADGVTVTYEAIADPTGSRTSSAADRTNFWQFAEPLFGVSLAPDVGLAGHAMPGLANLPQAMAFDAASSTFRAEGIPITPIDDAGATNTYPLMRVVARDAGGHLLATTDVVLPVSTELNCHACHASGSSRAAQPRDGWVHDPDPERDSRLNILRLHDDRELGGATFDAALATAGYDAGGLYPTAVGGTPVLCARCHLSEALPGSGLPEISPLTQAIHRRMAGVLDPITGLRMDDIGNRAACYRCHPGSETRCLRGAMGAAVAADGALAMQCQSCHGSMRDVAAPTRVGWLDEPACQSCHTGTATHNNGALRYTSVFEANGATRVAVDATFATNPETPAPGRSLYRFSIGHGGLRCEACHGATHAEYPSLHDNDNRQSEMLQGHAGVLSECDTCHAGAPPTVDGGPHGLHPLGQAWVEAHGDAAEEGGAAACRACHGTDYRGTPLSRALGERSLDTDFGRKRFWRGFQVGCFTCHQGPNSEEANPNRAPIAADDAAATRADQPVDVALRATDADGDPLTFRIVGQARHGTVALSGAAARYRPEPGFVGDDQFTFTASDGDTDGTLATVRVAVTALACPADCDADGQVTIAELVRAVNIALGLSAVDDCPSADPSGDAAVTVDELLQAVNAALGGCP